MMEQLIAFGGEVFSLRDRLQMQDYCLNKDDHQFILDVTQFKSRSPALEDPYKTVPTAVKSAFTR